MVLVTWSEFIWPLSCSPRQRHTLPWSPPPSHPPSFPKWWKSILTRDQDPCDKQSLQLRGSSAPIWTADKSKKDFCPLVPSPWNPIESRRSRLPQSAPQFLLLMPCFFFFWSSEQWRRQLWWAGGSTRGMFWLGAAFSMGNRVGPLDKTSYYYSPLPPCFFFFRVWLFFHAGIRNNNNNKKKRSDK